MSNYYLSNGKKWYYRLKEDTGAPGLLNELDEEDRYFKFIIFMFSSDGHRMYTYFDDYCDYISYYFKLKEERRCCDEIILEEKQQKMRFDIDAKKEELEDIQALFNSLIDAILKTYKEHGITLDISKDIIVCSSHSEVKWSLHLVLDNWYCDNSRECKEWYERTMRNLDKKYTKFIDSQIYGSNHAFRLLGSTKFNEKRYKVFNQEWNFKEDIIKYVYPEKIQSDKHKFLLEFDASAITLVSKCYPLPQLIQTKEENNYLMSHSLNDDAVLMAVELNKEKNGKSMKVIKIQGNLIIFSRGLPTHCIICDRVHETEGSFLVLKSVNNGQYEFKYDVYFDCRRSNGKRELLGTIKKNKFGEKIKGIEEKKNSEIDLDKLFRLAKKENKKLFF